MKVEVIESPGHGMKCPKCEKEGFAEPGENLCSECGTVFKVSF